MGKEKNKTALFEKPWLAMLAVMGASIFSMFLTGWLTYGLLGYPDDKPGVRFIQQMSFQVLTGFIIAPFILRLPKGKSTFRKYLDDIGLTRLKPFFRLVLLGLSCALILALFQAAASIVYRLFEGNPISGQFLRQVFNFSLLHPSQTPDLLLALPSVFEEVAFRGIVLTVFLGVYSERKSIIFSSIGFALMHLINLTNGRELVWVLGQLGWTFILGLFYGYVFVRTRSLLPSMIVHYLSNVTINLLSGYMIDRAGTDSQVLYQIIFSFGVLPTTLMILWTRFYSKKWLPQITFETKPVE
jgi:membrane protease YdiL (CAAX protease family)